jgi:hypothetical protein
MRDALLEMKESGTAVYLTRVENKKDVFFILLPAPLLFLFSNPSKYLRCYYSRILRRLFFFQSIYTI